MRQTIPFMHRLAFLGSGRLGFGVFSHLLGHSVSSRIEFVGVCRDEPTNPVCNAQNRDWQFFKDPEAAAKLIDGAARENDVPVYDDDLADTRFAETFIGEWNPTLLISLFFGQWVPTEFRKNRIAVNLHPCPIELGWPSKYAGPSPIKKLIADGYSRVPWLIHWAIDEMDAGPRIAWSSPIPINPALTHDEIFTEMGEELGPFVAKFIEVLLGLCSPRDAQPVAMFEHSTLQEILGSNPNMAHTGAAFEANSSNGKGGSN